jgi:hypothetical protein
MKRKSTILIVFRSPWETRKLTNARKLPALDPIETVLEINGISESGFFRGSQIDILGARRVERKATLRGMPESVRSFRVVSLHGRLAIGCVNVVVRKGLQHVCRTESRVRQRERVVRL